MQSLSNKRFVHHIIQGWEPFRKWHHIQVGASLPLGASLHAANDQSQVLWGVWQLHEAPSLRETALHLLLSELGGHGQPLLDQTVHRGKQSAASDLWGGLLNLLSSIKKNVLLTHKTSFSFVYAFSLVSASVLSCPSLVIYVTDLLFFALVGLRVCVCVCVLVSCCWQCVNETPSSAPAARDPCCRLSLTSSTWLTAMTAPPSPWQRMSSRSRVRERTVRPRRRWDTQTDTHTHNASRDMLSHII